jgi:hypothetical protein
MRIGLILRKGRNRSAGLRVRKKKSQPRRQLFYDKSSLLRRTNPNARLNQGWIFASNGKSQKIWIHWTNGQGWGGASRQRTENRDQDVVKKEYKFRDLPDKKGHLSFFCKLN